MKRFYKIVSTREDAEGFSILLDGKPVKMPGKKPLRVKNAALADALMQEWAAQKEHIVPHDMPLTQIVSTSLDRVAAERPAMTKSVLEYLDTDLLCYRAEEPPALAQKQAVTWDPHLAWFSQNFEAILLTTTKLEALTQPGKAHAAAQKFVTALDDDHFTVLQIITAVSGSLVLALAFTRGEVSAQQVFDATHVEEQYKATLYNEAKHGPDPAQEKKDSAMMRDLQAAQQFIELL
jgi:chaperone required for assembly of F1-ATPase